MQGEHSEMMYIVESGVVTCHMDFLRLQHRMQLPAVSKEILAVAPVRYTPTGLAMEGGQICLAFYHLLLVICCLQPWYSRPVDFTPVKFVSNMC